MMGLTEREREWGAQGEPVPQGGVEAGRHRLQGTGRSAECTRARGNRDVDHRQAGARDVRGFVLSGRSRGAGIGGRKSSGPLSVPWPSDFHFALDLVFQNLRDLSNHVCF